MTKVQIEELDSASVEDHGMSSQQERSDEPGNMNSEIREEVRHIAVKPQEHMKRLTILKMKQFKLLKNWLWFQVVDKKVKKSPFLRDLPRKNLLEQAESEYCKDQ